MGLQTKVGAAVLAALCAASALAQTTVSVPARIVTVPVPAQTIIVPARTLSVTVPATTITVPASSVSYTVPAYTLTLPGTQTCGALPAPLKQTASCPAGSTGTYTQTATYSAAAYPTCAVLGAYSPAAPPAGACAPVIVTPPPPVASNCGQQLGASPVIFCDTFDTAKPVAGTRSGDLDANVWGVSRLLDGTNFGQQQYNIGAPVHIQKCDGTAPAVVSPRDVVICNGQLREATNDNATGVFDDGTVTVLAMYPKQPFDFAGRTGTISFDVSNDTHGSHAAWPELWLTDLPVPAPFNHQTSLVSLPQNGFGIRFAAGAPPGNPGLCPNFNNGDKPRWTVDSAIVIRNYAMEDVIYNGFDVGTQSNPPLKLTFLDCVIAPADGSGVMNHVEVRVNQGEIDVYATDAGVAPSATTLRKIASITNANLTITRGLVWLEDAHYNADKGGTPTQKEHTFVWDNVAFDGPFTYRDFAYDAPDDGTAYSADGVLPGTIGLGKFSGANQTSAWNVTDLPANPTPAAARVLFNHTTSNGNIPTVITVTVNGHVHTQTWPYPANDSSGYDSWRTDAVTIPVTDLVAGTNVVKIGADQALVVSNVDIVLVNVSGGVPVLPGSNNAYPH